MAQPSPMRLRLVLLHEEVDTHRDFSCPHYDGCVDHAAIARWTSFSCRGCPVGRLSHLPPPIGGLQEDRFQDLPLTEQVRRLVTGDKRPWTLDEVHEAVGVDTCTRDQVTAALSHEASEGRIKRMAKATYGAPTLPVLPAPRRPRAVTTETPTARARALIIASGRSWTAEEVTRELGLQSLGSDRVRRLLMTAARRGHLARTGYGLYGPPGTTPAVGAYQRDRVLALMQDGEPRYPAEIAAELNLPRTSVTADAQFLTKRGLLERLGRGLYRRAE